MARATDYGRYRQYVSSVVDDLGVSRVRSVEDASVRWGIRDLSPAEFQHLREAAAQDAGLRERWRVRLELGYHREKLRLADEIEDLFAQIPLHQRVTGDREDAA